jgi:hypothetical protein
MNNPFLFKLIACFLLGLPYTQGNSQSTINAEPKVTASDSILHPSFSIDLPGLKAKKEKNNSISLDWPNKDTSFATQFEIERSADGINFSKLGEWNPDKVKNQSLYKFLDEHPLPVNHYRLKLIDGKGNYNYSKVTVISQNGAFNLAIHPNPFVQSFTLDIYETDPQTIKIQLMDMSGRLLRYKSVSGKAGNNKIEFDDVGNLRAGIYMLRIVRGYSVIEKKLIRSDQ